MFIVMPLVSLKYNIVMNIICFVFFFFLASSGKVKSRSNCFDGFS